jgi:nucleoside-diphosphate-sugar epimerase
VRLDAGPELPVRALATLSDHDFHALAHYAFVSRELIGELGWERYAEANAAIAQTVATAIAARRPRAVVLASSGAVHDPRPQGYAAIKRAEEEALRRAARGHGARALVLRIFSVSGPWIGAPQAYALSDLLLQAAAGGPLRIRSAAAVTRSYVAVEDLARLAAATLVAQDGPAEQVLDAAGEEPVEIGELARRVAVAIGAPGMLVERPPGPAGPPDLYVGDGAAMRALGSRLGVSFAGLDEQIRRTADALGLAGHTDTVAPS